MTGGGLTANGFLNATITDTSFVRNTFRILSKGYGEGGAIAVWDGANMAIESSNFTSNEAGSKGGGAIRATDNATVEISNTVFMSNTANIGGAICAANSSVHIHSSHFAQNPTWSPDGGGAIFCSNASVHIAATDFTKDPLARRNDDSQYNGIKRTVGASECVVTFDCQAPTPRTSVKMQDGDFTVLELPPAAPIVFCTAHPPASFLGPIVAGISFLLVVAECIRRLRKAKASKEGGLESRLIDKTATDLDPLLKETVTSACQGGMANSYVIDSSDITLEKGRILGRGAEGFVVRGKFNGAVCAVKVITLGLTMAERKSIVSDATREVKLLQQLHHPHIVQLYGLSVRYTSMETKLMLVMECCKCSLKDQLSDGAIHITPVQVLSFLLDVCRGMLYLHSHDFIHRDL
jgi:predicted outer membrane repeat protein